MQTLCLIHVLRFPLPRFFQNLGIPPVVLATVFLYFAWAHSQTRLAFQGWRRALDTPILSPQGNDWESSGVFNPTVVLYRKKFVMLYRAQDGRGTSRLGYAESRDGVYFVRR